MFIKVTRNSDNYRVPVAPITRAHAIALLQAGAILWSGATGEGWEMHEAHLKSKRALRRFIAARYADGRYFSGKDSFDFYMEPVP